MTYNQVRFVGGGRWATIVLTELVKNFSNLKIDWVCNSKIEERTEFIRRSSAFKNVTITEKRYCEDLDKPDKLIIASHSSQHCSDLLTHKYNDIPILIEKPIFPFYRDFEVLSKEEKSNIFINLEFYNAFFISDFFKKIQYYDLKKIKFEWHDPLTEKRDGEESKNSEIYSSIFMDQLIHVMSISKRMNLMSSDATNTRVEVDSDTVGCIKIFSDFGGVDVEISLSRLGNKRERKIDINSGEISLDFSSKPVIKKNGLFFEDIAESDRLFPIAQTLTEFVNYPGNPDISSLSVESLMPEISFCFKSEDLFIDTISEQLDVRDSEEREFCVAESNLVYYAGIKYYRQLQEHTSSSHLHFLKGNDGIKELLDWWDHIGKSN